MAKRRRYTEDQLLGPTPEPEGVLSKAKSVGLSGLSYAGNLLGTPGAVIKNTLAGKNPLTPILHPLSGEGRVEGRDLLRQNGLVGQKNTWGNWGAGLAVDIATDPLTYINPLGFATKLGALTKAGKAAHAIGALDDVTKVATAAGRKAGRLGAGQTVGRASARARTTLGELLEFGDPALKAERWTAAHNYATKQGTKLHEMLDQPLGGVASWWLPGVGSGVLGAGKGGAEFLEGAGRLAGMIPGARVASAAASATKRTIKGFFHGPSGGRFDKYGQLISELAHEKMPAARRATVRQSLTFWDRFKQVDDEFRKAFKPETAAPQPSTSGLAEGDLVKALDRGNYGYVESLADDGASVHFTHPETGATATVKMPFSQLEKGNSADLPESLRAIHDPVARVFDRILRMTAETKGDVDAAIGKFAKGANISPALRDDIAKLAQDAVEAKDALWQQNLELGGKGNVLGDFEDFQHFPRYLVKRGTGPLDTFKQLPVGHESTAGREPYLRYLRADQIEDLRMNPKYRPTNGTVAEEWQKLENWLSDADLAHPDYDANSAIQQMLKAQMGKEGPTAVAKHAIRGSKGDNVKRAAERILADFGDSLGYQAKEGPVSPQQHAAELAEYVGKAGQDAVEKQKRLFDNMTFQDLSRYLLQAHKRNASFRAIHEAFHMNLGESGAKLEDAFKFAGMDHEAALAHFSKIAGMTPEQLASARVPAELANAAAAVVKTYEEPEWANLVTGTLDTINRYFKPAMVLVKPAFWFRNHTSGQYANLVSGYINSPQDIADYLKAYREVNGLWKSGDKAFNRELEIMGVVGQDSTLEAHRHVYEGAMPAHDALPPNPLNVRQTAKEVESRLTQDPTGLFGKSVKGLRKGAGTWMETNAKANRVVEYHNRAALYKYLTGKGFTPEKAAQIVTDVHYDYSTRSMAPLEREVMRRIVPFYVFSRNNLPWTVERLVSSPGGPMAQTIKAAARSHRHEDLSPEYLSETASIPMGDLPDGSRRYLTGFGLGFEDPAGFATPSLKQVGLEAISRTNPVIKGPLEYMFGQSAFQKGPFGGRSLEDLDPALGRTLANIGQITGLRSNKAPVRYPGNNLIEHVLSNSPLSGVLTSARTLTDPRKSPQTKAANLLTGVHFSDVSPASMDRELRNRVNRITKEMGGVNFIDTFMPKEVKESLSPEQRAEVERLQALKKLLEERSKSRKK